MGVLVFLFLFHSFVSICNAKHDPLSIKQCDIFFLFMPCGWNLSLFRWHSFAPVLLMLMTWFFYLLRTNRHVKVSTSRVSDEFCPHEWIIRLCFEKLIKCLLLSGYRLNRVHVLYSSVVWVIRDIYSSLEVHKLKMIDCKTKTNKQKKCVMDYP